MARAQPPRDRKFGGRILLHSPLLLAAAVLVVSLLATYQTWQFVDRQARTAATEAFANEVRSVAAEFSARLADHALALRGAAALLRMHPETTIDDWQDYVAATRLAKAAAGVQSIGFVQRIMPDQRDAVVARMRAQGLFEFDVWPRGNRPEYAAVVHVAPLQDGARRALGSDMLVEAARADAVQRARDTGEPALSGKIVLTLDQNYTDRVSFMLFMPVYRDGAPTERLEDRRSAVTGYVFSLFRANKFIDAMLKDAESPLRVEIYDGAADSEDRLLYPTDVARDSASLPLFRAQTQVSFGGRTWIVYVASTPSFEAAVTRPEPRIVLFWGLAASVLLTGGTWWLTREFGRRRRSQAELAGRVARQARLAELGRVALTGSLGFPELCDEVVRAIVDVADLPIVGIMELSRDGKSVIMRHQLGFGRDTAPNRGIEVGTGSQAGYTLLSKAPVVVENTQTETRFQVSPVLIAHRVVTGITVAIHGNDRPWGVLGAHTTEWRELSQDDINFLDSIAHILSQVVRRDQQMELLRQAQKMEAVGQLTGGIAHDFNNLLTVILGNAEYLASAEADSEDIKAQAALVVTAATRGAELTQHLLAFSRRQPLNPSMADLNELVTAMEPFLKRTLGEHIEIEWRREPGLWSAFTDKGQVENCLLNLAVNARDAMPNGGKLIIETGNVTLDKLYAASNEEVAPGEYVMLAVTDTGTGMPPDVAARAFEPFFTTKDVGQGSGLGLSMIYGFVKQSGGHVKLYSELGHGTAIKIYLPRAAADAAAAGADAEVASARGGGETILVVEDDDQVRGLAVRLIKGLGYQVVEASNGRSALAALERVPDVHLIFSDVVMPGGMSGPQLIAEARAKRPELKVLLTSGYPEHAAHDAHGPLDAELLTKPYRKRDLARKLREMLDRPAA